jgi:catechol 2,3-dioxygenase-like lactoylglutathione lyase family enzyme
MVQLRHTGLYVADLDLMENFYKEVFGMHTICSHQIQKDDLINGLLGNSDAEIMVSKLITDQGRQSGTDDMLELVHVVLPSDHVTEPSVSSIWESGTMHLGFGVDSVQDTAAKLIENGGQKVTEIHEMSNGKSCGFFEDPEGNYIELISSM